MKSSVRINSKSFRQNIFFVFYILPGIKIICAPGNSYFSWGVWLALAYVTCIYIQVYSIALINTKWCCDYLKLCCDHHLYIFLSCYDLNFQWARVEMLFISLQSFIQHITIYISVFFVIFHLYNFIKLDSCLIYFLL